MPKYLESRNHYRRVLYRNSTLRRRGSDLPRGKLDLQLCSVEICCREVFFHREVVENLLLCRTLFPGSVRVILIS